MNLESELLIQALALPEAERAELASRLLLSLEPDESIEGHDSAWVEEIGRRRQAFDRGETTATPWREAMGRIEQGLGPGADG